MRRFFTHLNTGLLRLIPLALILVLVISIIGPGTAQADPGWYNSSWQYRKKITIDNTKVSANLTNFPVLISITDTDLVSHALSNGDDILFTAADEITKLSHEIESYNATAEKLVAWVKIPSLLSASDTDIYMYYGNGGASNQEDATGVWDTNYNMVQHLEDTTSGTDNITDSTANDNHGTDVNTPTLGATGQVDGAIGFDGTNEYIYIGDTTFPDSAAVPFSVSMWVKPTDFSQSGQALVDKYDGGTSRGWTIEAYSTTGTPYLGVKSDGWIQVRSTNTLASGIWTYVVFTYDGSKSASGVSIYLNGSPETEIVPIDALTANDISNNINLQMGARNGTNNPFDGVIDEVRISNTARSTGWIQTSYNNQSNPSSFYTLGSEEAEIVTPTVTTDNATLVEETTATINGTLTNDGGEACQYRFQWGTTQGGPYTDNTTWTGSLTTGQSFSANIISLSKGTKYYFIAEAKNNTGTDSGTELTFLTKPDAPTSFSAMTASSSQINLSWAKGDGANRTMIRRKEGDYPTSVSDGVQVYFDTSTSTSDTGLLPSTTYFYSAWSEVSGSQQYSDTYAQANATTTSGAPTVIGGLVLPVNKATVLAPWLLLGVILSLVIARIVIHIRKTRSSAHY